MRFWKIYVKYDSLADDTKLWSGSYPGYTYQEVNCVYFQFISQIRLTKYLVVLKKCLHLSYQLYRC